MAMFMRRMKRELELLRNGAAPGVAAWLADESRMDRLEGELTGAEGTPYEGGIFRLDVSVPTEYPLKPPAVRFLTKIYHPNIDSEGRICLDTLNMPPKGAWKPALNIATLLTTVLALLSSPNPDDGLMPDISDLFRRDRATFERTAREWTKRYAKPGANVTPDKAEKAPAPSPGATKPSESSPGPSRSKLSRLRAKPNQTSSETECPKSDSSRETKQNNDPSGQTPAHRKFSLQRPKSVDKSPEAKPTEKPDDKFSNPSVRNPPTRRNQIEIESSPESSPARNQSPREEAIIIDSSSSDEAPAPNRPSRRRPIQIDDDSPEPKRSSPVLTNAKSKQRNKRKTSPEPPALQQKKKPEKRKQQPSNEIVIFDSDEDEEDEQEEEENNASNDKNENDDDDNDDDNDDLFTEPKSAPPAPPPKSSSKKKASRLKRRPMTPPLISDDDEEDEVEVVHRAQPKPRATRERPISTPPPPRAAPRRMGSRLKRRRH